jgi:hypothetical protein
VSTDIFFSYAFSWSGLGFKSNLELFAGSGFVGLHSLLQVRDVYSIPDHGSRVKKAPDFGSATKNLCTVFFYPERLMLSEIWSGVFIPDPDFFPISDPGSRGQKSFRLRTKIRKHWLILRI